MEVFKDETLKDILYILQIIALLPIFNFIRAFLSSDEIDNVMLSRPKQRMKYILMFIELIVVIGILTALGIYELNPSPIVINEENKNKIYLVSRVFAVTSTIAIEILTSNIRNNFHEYFYTESNEEKIFNRGFMLSYIGGIIAIFASVKIYSSNDLLNMAIWFLTFLTITKLKRNTVLLEKMENEKFKLITIGTIIGLYYLSFIYLYANKGIENLDVNIVIGVYIIVAVILAINDVSEKYAKRGINYFICNDDIFKLYNIDIFEGMDWRDSILQNCQSQEEVNYRIEKLKSYYRLYIYYTTNDKYFVCGKDPIKKKDNKHYIIAYEDVIKSGGFLSLNLSYK